jgi:hypothetical protein
MKAGLCWARDEVEAVRVAHERSKFATLGLGGDGGAVGAREFRSRRAPGGQEDLAQQIACGPEPPARGGGAEVRGRGIRPPRADQRGPGRRVPALLAEGAGAAASPTQKRVRVVPRVHGPLQVRTFQRCGAASKNSARVASGSTTRPAKLAIVPTSLIPHSLSRSNLDSIVRAGTDSPNKIFNA